MADEAPKGNKGKSRDGVLAGLPATRPSRMSRRARSGGPSLEATRAAAAQTADTREATGSRASGKRTTAADKTRKTEKVKAGAKAGATRAATAKASGGAKAGASSKAKVAPGAKAGATRAGAAKTATAAGAKATAKPAARKPKAAPAPANVKPLAEAPKPARKPRAVRVGSPALKAPTEKAESRRDDVPVARPAQSGTELVTTVVQAAGELASIGITVGGQILKRAAGKLPRP